MMASLRDHRDSAENQSLSIQASELIEIVGDCMNRHRELHNLVLAAEQTFYVEQHRQAFLPAVHLRGVDLMDELLLPALSASLDSALPVLLAFSETVWGLRGPRLARLGSLFSMLLAESREPSAGVPVPNHALDEDTADPRRFSREAWSAAQSILEEDGSTPRRLSSLLQRARSLDVQGVDELVALRALAAFDPMTRTPRPGQMVVAATRDGLVLDDPQWSGADLLVGTLTVDGERLRAAFREKLEGESQ
jgi:hypothetical protein